jgi:hypothetical protein
MDVFWVLTEWGLVGWCRRFGELCCHRLQAWSNCILASKIPVSLFLLSGSQMGSLCLPAKCTIGHISMQPHNIIQMLYTLNLVKFCLEAITSTPQIEAAVSSKALVSNPRMVPPYILLNLESNARLSWRDIYISPEPDWKWLVRRKHVLYSQSAIKFHHVVTGLILWRLSISWLFWHLIWRETNSRIE